MDANTAKRWLGLDGKNLRTPNVLEFFVFTVLILFAFYFIGIIDSGTGREQQILLLIISAGSSAVISTFIKTYLERDILFM
jgi:hypothetical protein